MGGMSYTQRNHVGITRACTEHYVGVHYVTGGDGALDGQTGCRWPTDLKGERWNSHTVLNVGKGQGITNNTVGLVSSQIKSPTKVTEIESRPQRQPGPNPDRVLMMCLWSQWGYHRCIILLIFISVINSNTDKMYVCHLILNVSECIT